MGDFEDIDLTISERLALHDASTTDERFFISQAIVKRLSAVTPSQLQWRRSALKFYKREKMPLDMFYMNFVTHGKKDFDVRKLSYNNMYAPIYFYEAADPRRKEMKRAFIDIFGAMSVEDIVAFFKPYDDAREEKHAYAACLTMTFLTGDLYFWDYWEPPKVYKLRFSLERIKIDALIHTYERRCAWNIVKERGDNYFRFKTDTMFMAVANGCEEHGAQIEYLGRISWQNQCAVVINKVTPAFSNYFHYLKAGGVVVFDDDYISAQNDYIKEWRDAFDLSSSSSSPFHWRRVYFFHRVFDAKTDYENWWTFNEEEKEWTYPPP